MKQFTITHYKQLISGADDVLRVVDWAKDSPKTGLILRHDVDLSLSLAYEFSMEELSIGALSTYYVLMTSNLYNPFSRINRVLLRKMRDAGFEIGLHFNPRAYGILSEYDLQKALVNECNQLQDVLGKAVRSYCFHNPSSYGKTEVGDIADLINAYNTEIFNDDCYISDSLFSFRGKDPVEWIEKSKTKVIQFLTHPFQYFQ